MEKQNKAVVLTAPKTLEFKDIEMPVAKPGEILMKLDAVGVCGSDVHYYSHGRIGNFIVEYPFILGHECAGTVIGLGEGVTSLKVGDRVALEPGVPCGQCEYCLSGHYNLCPDIVFFATPPIDGCLMNYITFPAKWAFKLPDNVSSVEGALVEPLAIGINATLTAKVKLGDTVVIFGSGCIGLVTLLAAKAAGAAKVIVCDVLDKRLAVAEKFGAITVNSREVDPVEKIRELTDGNGAHIVIDCAGFNETVLAAIEVAKSNARIVLVGLAADEINHIPLNTLSVKELTITSMFRYKNIYPIAIAAIASGSIPIKDIVSNEFKFEQTPEAYKTALENAAETVKSVILFD